jgi:hypothetical protein
MRDAPGDRVRRRAPLRGADAELFRRHLELVYN